MAIRKSEEMKMKQRLLEARDALLKQRDAIDNEIKGLERAIALVGVDEAEKITPSRSGRPPVKVIILDLLEDVGTSGADASGIVAMAHDKGITLDKGSVSSTLSRMKKDDVLHYDGTKYRLRKFAPKSAGISLAAPGPGAFN